MPIFSKGDTEKAPAAIGPVAISNRRVAKSNAVYSADWALKPSQALTQRACIIYSITTSYHIAVFNCVLGCIKELVIKSSKDFSPSLWTQEECLSWELPAWPCVSTRWRIVVIPPLGFPCGLKRCRETVTLCPPCSCWSKVGEKRLAKFGVAAFESHRAKQSSNCLRNKHNVTLRGVTLDK